MKDLVRVYYFKRDASLSERSLGTVPFDPSSCQGSTPSRLLGAFLGRRERLRVFRELPGRCKRGRRRAALRSPGRPPAKGRVRRVLGPPPSSCVPKGVGLVLLDPFLIFPQNIQQELRRGLDRRGGRDLFFSRLLLFFLLLLLTLLLVLFLLLQLKTVNL